MLDKGYETIKEDINTVVVGERRRGFGSMEDLEKVREDQDVLWRR